MSASGMNSDGTSGGDMNGSHMNDGAISNAGARRLRLALLGPVLLAAAACGMLPGLPSRPTPIADRPINLDGDCVQTEEDGFRENTRLVVRNSQVQSLSWELQVGRRGSCRFEQADFRQTQSRPHIELRARDGSGCRLLVWQEPRRVTLAHNGCESRCTAGIYDQAWPVMFDPATGRCARTQ